MQRSFPRKSQNRSDWKMISYQQKKKKMWLLVIMREVQTLYFFCFGADFVLMFPRRINPNTTVLSISKLKL